MNTDQRAQAFLTLLADAIVGAPGLVPVWSSGSRGRIILFAAFPAEHHGKAVGQHGATIDGLRLIMVLAGRKWDIQPFVRLKPPEVPFAGDIAPFAPKLNWNCGWLVSLATRLADHCFLNPVAVTVTDRSDGTTAVQFRLSATEPTVLPDEQIQNGFRAVLKVIGMANGRKLYFDLKRA